MNKMLLALLLLPLLSMAQKYPTPDQLYGELFKEVQLQQVFPDGKTFVDCTPKRKIADIMYDYGMMKGPSFDLKKFVADNFTLPPAPPQLNYIQQEKNPAQHIRNLWGTLHREADVSARWEGKDANGNSLLALPYPYVVPGGRFREIYYWDSYFTMLGLIESGETTLAENMVKNFDYLIYTFGHVPNGNRTYYLSRSQPPFFSMMVELLASVKGKAVYKKYLPSLLKEYNYWMQDAATLKQGASKRVVRMKDGEILNRYWDELSVPRQESYREDVATAEAAAQELAMRVKMASPELLQQLLDKRRATAYNELRAGACSGWDFSSRWLTAPDQLASIQTTQLIPVDLNGLLYQLEKTIATASRVSGKPTQAKLFDAKAAGRKKAVLKYCWNKEKSFFVDYNYVVLQQSEAITAAGFFPLFVKMASAEQAAATAALATQQLVKAGGLVTTTVTSGQQWDAPNGWAPLQWVAVKGLRNYQLQEPAATIAQRWLALNNKVYAETGKFMEKYNVEDISLAAGGGEYPSQDGFGWTNGVYLALLKIYPLH